MLTCKFYRFLYGLVGAAIIIPWAVLCGTYLVFRKACDQNNVPGVKEAQSPFQPWLACWGLFWSSMIGTTTPFSRQLIHQLFFMDPRLSWGSILCFGQNPANRGRCSSL